jgi:hypothetical protein
MARLSRTAMGALAQTFRASARAADRTSAAGTTAFTSPSWAARAAGIGSPVAIISSAMALGRARGKRKTPPAAATRLRFTSGKPKVAVSATTARSQASSSSSPPAKAWPCAAAIHSLLRSARTKPAKPPFSVARLALRPAETSFRSAPAQKACGPAPVSTAAQISGSASTRSTAASSPCATAPLTALRASGRLIVTSATRGAASSNRTASPP